MDYALPRADDLPAFETTLTGAPTGNNSLGVKGAGECGTMGAPGVVINAVVDALAGHGVRHVDMPATPERIWRALRRAGSRGGADE
jgi:carbon-monoxide dehydrogenase large subunit